MTKRREFTQASLVVFANHRHELHLLCTLPSWAVLGRRGGGEEGDHSVRCPPSPPPLPDWRGLARAPGAHCAGSWHQLGRGISITKSRSERGAAWRGLCRAPRAPRSRAVSGCGSLGSPGLRPSERRGPAPSGRALSGFRPQDSPGECILNPDCTSEPPSGVFTKSSGLNPTPTRLAMNWTLLRPPSECFFKCPSGFRHAAWLETTGYPLPPSPAPLPTLDASERQGDGDGWASVLGPRSLSFAFTG
ncbi:uncharacterized protein LOC117074083 [Trachypithecus francoisi]|uniref:uncharacterized protein LOC117074083 n=1 Tax=Trachypithecus francoisi TaxID=54180 RepID=UPI00141A8AA7|nr:uncharacterized protein LOC117074083 [Trachypithecus francoisi]